VFDKFLPDNNDLGYFVIVGKRSFVYLQNDFCSLIVMIHTIKIDDTTRNGKKLLVEV